MNLWKMQVPCMTVADLVLERESRLRRLHQALMLAWCDLCRLICMFFCACDIIRPECSQCMRRDARHSSSAPHRISLLLVNTTPFLHWVEKYRALCADTAWPSRLCGGFGGGFLQTFIEKHDRLSAVWSRFVIAKLLFCCFVLFCFVLFF